MVKRCFLSIVVLLVVLLLNTAIASAESFMTITLKPIDYQVLVEGSAEDMEAEVYPSKMQLPTKWLDLAAFVPFEGEMEVESEVAILLDTNWPSNDGWTYPEYYAAKMYLGCVKALEHSTVSQTAASLYQREHDNWSLDDDMLTASVTVNKEEYLHRMFKLFEEGLTAVMSAEQPDNNENYLDMVDGTSFPFVVSMGYNYPWLSVSAGGMTSDADLKGQKFFESIPLWHDAMALSISPATTKVITPTKEELEAAAAAAEHSNTSEDPATTSDSAQGNEEEIVSYEVKEVGSNAIVTDTDHSSLDNYTANSVEQGDEMQLGLAEWVHFTAIVIAAAGGLGVLVVYLIRRLQ